MGEEKRWFPLAWILHHTIVALYLNPEWSNYSCGAAIVLEPTSESLVTLYGVAALFGFIAGIREKQLVAFTLMVAFAVIVCAELGQSPQQRAHLRPSFRQGQRDRSADTLGRAGYQGHSPLVRSFGGVHC